PQPQKGTDLHQVYQAQKKLALATDNLKAGNQQLALTLTKLENQNTAISKLSVASQKINLGNQQISQAFSHTYLVGAVIVLILSPIALLTDRKPLT
ncbi:MFS transporter, partial [Lactiplantibacillus plantarum]